jgi:hypothetical protein
MYVMFTGYDFSLKSSVHSIVLWWVYIHTIEIDFYVRQVNMYQPIYVCMQK